MYPDIGRSGPQYGLSLVMVALGDNVFQLIDYVSFVLWSMVGGAVAGQLWWRYVCRCSGWTALVDVRVF